MQFPVQLQLQFKNVLYCSFSGRNNITFLICNGSDPSTDQHKPIKKNRPLEVAFAATVVVYIFVFVKVKKYEKKEILPTVSATVSAAVDIGRSNLGLKKHLPEFLNSVLFQKSQNLIDLSTICSILTFFTPLILLVVYLGKVSTLTKLDTFPNYFLADFLQFYLTSIWHVTILCKIFSKSDSMSKVVKREVIRMGLKYGQFLKELHYRCCKNAQFR